MYQNILIVAVTVLADFYYYLTYTNRLITKFYKGYAKEHEKILLKKSNVRVNKKTTQESNVYIRANSESHTLLSINNNESSSTTIDAKKKYNSAEMLTLLWYADGEYFRIGRCFNKDYTVLLLLAIISDLNREGKVDLCEYDIYPDKGILLCIDDSKTGIPYYDFCLDLFKDKKSIPLHVFINMGVIKGSMLRNMVMEDLEKKELAEREVKEHVNGKIKCNYWTLRMPIECQRWFRDYVFKDFNTDPSIKTLIDLMIYSSEVLYQKDHLFRNIFGKNEIFYIKKKYSDEGITAPHIVITSDGNITKEFSPLNKKKMMDEETEITIENDI